jgi:hypothetical protein
MSFQIGLAAMIAAGLLWGQFCLAAESGRFDYRVLAARKTSTMQSEAVAPRLKAARGRRPTSTTSTETGASRRPATFKPRR